MVTVNAGHNPGAPVLSVIARDAENKVAKFSPQNISNTLHGFAKLEWHPGNLMDTMADELLRKIDGFSPQVNVTPADSVVIVQLKMSSSSSSRCSTVPSIALLEVSAFWCLVLLLISKILGPCEQNSEQLELVAQHG